MTTSTMDHGPSVAARGTQDSPLATGLQGVALAAVFGLAIGARYGALSMAIHAVGVPLGMVAAVGLSAPAAAIAFSHFDLPVDLVALWRGAADAAAAAAIAGLALASVLGARRLWSALGAARQTELGTVWSYCMLLGLLLVAGLIAARAWWLLLPMLGGPLATGGAT
jgi:hypothetical protein